MITHLVLLQPKAGATEDDIRSALEYIDALEEEELPVRIFSEVVPNKSAAHHDFPYALIIRSSLETLNTI